MRIFKCIITGDEMFSDTYPMREENGFYIVKGKYISRKGDSVDDSLLGGNPSAEEAADDCDDSAVESGINVILDARMKETGFGAKKEYAAYMKEYMGNVMAKLKERGDSSEVIDAAKADATSAFKEVYAKYKDLQFFSGAGDNPDGHIALMIWVDEEENGNTVQVPYIYFYKSGMLSEKV